MRRLLAPLLFLTLACGPQRRLNPCSPSAQGVADPPILLSVVGQPIEVELLLPPAVYCPDGNPISTAVTTEVLDPLNRPVVHTHSDPASSNTQGYSTRVSFTPTTAGVHYVSARFEPALGITQRQLQVALDRSAETPWQRTSLGGLCDEVLPLREAILCRRGAQVTLVRDGGVELTENVTAIASSGSVGWLWTDTRLTRLDDADGGLARADYAIQTNRAAFAVTEERWVQPNGSGFVEVSFTDGGLSDRRWSVGPTFGPVAGPSLVLSGEAIGWATQTNICSSVPDASVNCIDSVLQPNASEGDALWLRGAESGVMGLARFDSRGNQPVVIFVPAQPTALQEARTLRAVFNYDGLLVAVRADDLSFEGWRTPTNVARQAVTESFVVFQLQSGETVIYRR